MSEGWNGASRRCSRPCVHLRVPAAAVAGVSLARDDDDGDLAPLPHRVVHHVHSGAEPQSDRGRVQPFQRARRRNRTHGDGAGGPRHAPRQEGLAHGRPQAVGADQHRRGERAACRISDRDLPGLSLHRGRFEPGVDVDQGMGGGRRGKGAVKIAAVHHPVGGAVPLGDPAPQRQPGEMAAAGAGAHHDGLRLSHLRLQGVGDTQPPQGAHAVGAELDAGACRRRRLLALQNARAAAVVRQGKREGQPADAAACDQHRQRVAHLRWAPSGRLLRRHQAAGGLGTVRLQAVGEDVEG